MSNQLIVVAGGGGFLGGHWVAHLVRRGCDPKHIVAIDSKPLDQWHQVHDGVGNHQSDLREIENCRRWLRGAVDVYNFAADMGGIGFIEQNKWECMLNVLINTHLLMAAREQGVARFFFASSACVYRHDKQQSKVGQALREEDAYPAMPEDGYGWEKLFSERMCRHFTETFGIATKVARLHNVYGPFGTWTGGREKAPAAICRKAIEAERSDNPSIEVWGDGEQTRSFMFIDNCVEGIQKIMDSDVSEPINLGSSEMVSINQLIDLVEELSGQSLRRTYLRDKPTGVPSRNSDNTRIRQLLNWEPTTPLREGLGQTYRWIEDEIAKAAVESKH